MRGLVHEGSDFSNQPKKSGWVGVERNRTRTARVQFPSIRKSNIGTIRTNSNPTSSEKVRRH